MYCVRGVVNDCTSQRGSVLLAALAVNALILLLTVSYFPYFQAVVRAPAFAYRHDQARQLAEAGISEALWEYNADGAAFAGNGWSYDPSSDACTKTAALQAGDGSGVTLGQYSVGIMNCRSSSPVVTATGYIPSQSSPSATSTVRATLQRPIVVDSALYADQLVEVIDQLSSNTIITIDAYDSTLGPYSIGNNNVTVATNGTWGDGGPATDLNFHADLFGGTLRAPTGAMVSYTSGTLVWGPRRPPMPAVEIPPQLRALEPGCTGAIQLWMGMTQTLTGDNCFHSVELLNGSRLILAPNARLYIYAPGGSARTYFQMSGTGGQRLEAQGNNQVYLNGVVFSVNGKDNSAMVVTNANPRPQDLRIFQTGITLSTDTSFLSQQQPFYGTIYADSGTVHVANYDTYVGNPTQWWNATYYGAFYGPLVKFEGAGAGYQLTLHYDTSLRNLAANSGTAALTIKSWQQL